jgi:hypothetical protein
MTPPKGKIHYEHKSDDDVFLETLDGMIESTEEFIRDDGLNADDQRIIDLAACIQVRKLFVEAFQIEDS